MLNSKQIRTGAQRTEWLPHLTASSAVHDRVLVFGCSARGSTWWSLSPPWARCSGVLVDPEWRGRGIATALTRARLRWVFARSGTVFYVTGADNAVSLHLHAALGFQEIKRFDSERSAAGVHVLSELARTAADPNVRPATERLNDTPTRNSLT